MAFDSDELLQRADDARLREATGEKRPTLATLSFLLEGELYGIPLARVVEVSKVSPVTPVPGLPPAILGAMNLRGELIAVLDPKPRLGLPPGRIGAASRLLVVRHGAERIGLLADAIGDIVEVELPEKTSGAAGDVAWQAVLGTALLNQLDLDRLLQAIAG